MRLMQVRRPGGGRGVVAIQEGEAWFVAGVETVYEMARRAAAERARIAELVEAAGRAEPADPRQLLEAGLVLAPIDHPDSAHVLVSGTGLTHLGSAATRDAMHAAADTPSAVPETDSMRMFRMGLEGGKPAPGTVGVQPEWFYKGDGSILVGPGEPLRLPPFAQDGGEEPEVAGIYIIDDDGLPRRIGFALCNEYSDHVMEKHNYLWLAHSKLRNCALGPELLLGDLPESVEGISRVRRGDAVLFEKPFLTGEANMSHSIANLEAHHFKYRQFRRPGDVHVHTFGTATLSFAEGIRAQPGDVFEIEAAPFELPLTNPLEADPAGYVPVLPL